MRAQQPIEHDTHEYLLLASRARFLATPWPLVPRYFVRRLCKLPYEEHARNVSGSKHAANVVAFLKKECTVHSWNLNSK